MSEKKRLTTNAGCRNCLKADPIDHAGVTKALGIPVGEAGRDRRGEQRRWS